MNEKDEAQRIANENANLIGIMPEVFEMMASMLPDEERELFDAAREGIDENVKEAQEALRSGAVNDELIARKPPALWDFEKAMFNKLARDAGMPEIEDDQ